MKRVPGNRWTAKSKPARRSVNSAKAPIAGAIARATAPATPATRNALGQFVTIGKAPSVVARGASALSRAAGPIGLAAETIFGDGAAGHRPISETADTTAARQTDFAHKFKEQVNREAGYEVIRGTTTPEIIESIARYRAGR